VRFGDDGRQLLDGVLGGARVRTRRHAAPGGHHLDEVDAALAEPPGRLDRLVDPICLQAAEVQVAARGGDRHPRRQDTRAGNQSAVNAVAQRQGEQPSAAAVAQGRNPTAQLRLGVGESPQQQGLVGVVDSVVERLIARAEEQVGVTVDQAGQQRTPGIVAGNDVGPLRHVDVAGSSHVRDRPVDADDDPVVDRVRPGAVDEARRAEYSDAGHWLVSP